MVINVFNAKSYFNGEEDVLEHDRGMVINLETGEIRHCLLVDDWGHDYTIIIHKDKDGKETEIAIGSLDELDNDDLIELREAYGYKVSEDKDDCEDDYDDYSCGYKSKFD